MVCRACERRRVFARIMMQAAKEWATSPARATYDEILKRLRDEAIERGEIDDKPD